MTPGGEKNDWKTLSCPTALGVGAFALFQYGSGLWRLAGQSGGMESKFSQVAVEQHLDYLVWQNVWVLGGYALLALVAWVLVMPAVVAVSGRWAGKAFWKSGVVAVAACAMVHGYFMFRLAYTRPYFTGDAEFGDWYYRLLELPPESVRPWVLGFCFRVLPWAALAAVAVWWWQRCRNWVRFGAVAAMAVVGWLVVGAGDGRGNSKPVAEVSSERPNVLIIGSDSLRGDRLGYAGYRPERTDGAAAAGVSPHIDAWAKEALVFEKCWTPIGSTLESGISMMSSSYPHQHGIRQMFPTRDQVEGLAEKVKPLASVLREEGYDTAAMGDWCASYYEVTPLGFGEVDVSSFDSFRIYVSQAVIMAHFVVPLYFDHPLGYRIFPQVKSFAQFVTPEVVTKRVEDRIAHQAASGRPFFWHVFYSLNHLPYRSAEPYCRMFSDPAYRGKNATGVDFDIDEFIGSTGLEDKWAALPEEEARQIRALYDGCTRQFDECFARILKSLEDHGLLENTIVVLTADHGDDLYEQGVTLGHGLSFNGADHSFRIPLAIRGPGVEAARHRGQVRSIDIVPTVASLLSVEREPKWRGVDLMAWRREGGGERDLPMFAETQFPFIQFRVPGVERPQLPPMDELTFIDPDFSYHFVLKPDFRERLLGAKQRCLRTGEWKIVCTPDVVGRRHFQLFHTGADPDCRRDVAGARPEVLGPMRAALERWMDTGEETAVAQIFPNGEPVGRAP